MKFKLNIHQYYQFSDFSNAYLNCLKHKTNSSQARDFQFCNISELYHLYTSVNSGTYKPDKSICFAITSPKPREIWAAQFKDRIIHHLVVSDIQDWYLARIINTNCSCVLGRGTLFGINKAIEYFRKVSRNYHYSVYVLQCDIKNFFVSIDKEILTRLLLKHIPQDSLTYYLLYTTIYNYLRYNAYYVFDNLHRVPDYKSLRYSDNSHGLPVGDLTSQILSGYIYLNELDQYIKHVLKIKYYVRYVDDFVIFGTDRSKLIQVKDQIDSFLQEYLKLSLNQDKSKIHQEVFTFLGRRILKFRSYLKNYTRNKIKHNLSHASLMAYYGLLKHANEYTFCELLNIV